MDKKQKVYLIWVVLFLLLLFFQEITATGYSNINIGIVFFLEVVFIAFYFFNRKDFINEKETSRLWKILISICLSVFVAILFLINIKEKYIDKTALYYPSTFEKVRWLCLSLIAGFTEEALLKKLLYEKLLTPIINKWVAILICSFVFTLMHFEAHLISFILFMVYEAITTMFYEKWSNVYVYGLFLALTGYAIYI